MPSGHPKPPATTEERLERLLVATSALITEVSLDGVLQQVVQVAAEVIGAHYAAIGVLAPDGRLLESFTTYGINDERARAASARCRAGTASSASSSGRPVPSGFPI